VICYETVLYAVKGVPTRLRC